MQYSICVAVFCDDLYIIIAGEKYDGDIMCTVWCFQQLTKASSVHSFHRNIHKDEVGMFFIDGVKKVLSIQADGYVIACTRKFGFQEKQYIYFIIY